MSNQDTLSDTDFIDWMRPLIENAQESENQEKLERNATHPVTLSYGSNRYSIAWGTSVTTWGATKKVLALAEPFTEKNGPMIVPGRLEGGDGPEGARRQKTNVTELSFVTLDFDKGDASLDDLEARANERGIEAAIFPTHSDGKDTSSLDWEVEYPMGQSAKPCAFKKYVSEKLGKHNVELGEVTPELAKSFMVEVQGFQSSVLGDVTVLDTKKHSMESVKTKDGWKKVKKISLAVKHNPIAKSRAVLPLMEAVVRQPDETPQEYQRRWENDVYHAVGRWFGFDYDPACASTERAHHAMTRNPKGNMEPTRFVSGALLDPNNPEIVALRGKPETNKKSKKARHKQRMLRKKARRAINSALYPGGASKWSGFLAADAAADHIAHHIDKRNDPDHPLVAVPCPFVHEHATTNDPSVCQCYMYNASDPTRLPVVKCHSNTCSDRPSEEFLDTLFEERVLADPTYRIFGTEVSGRTFYEGELDEAFQEMNQYWSVVKMGNKTRFVHFREDGGLEFLDRSAASDWLSNWKYIVGDGDDFQELPVFSLWKKSTQRRQYDGMGFYPNPEKVPDRTLNLWTGFAVEAKNGDWSLLLRHIYRNICRRDPKLFRFFIAALAQIIQQPDIKLGFGIALRGKEGVGKSILGAYIVRLFGKHAMIISDQERITGRFNSHFEDKVFALLEEAIWAGDKDAEGKLKDMVTNIYLSYERKGIDPYEAPNYTRFMIATNEAWCVPAASGGRRWLVMDVGDEQEQNHAYFSAISDQMENGGLEAMLHDLLHHDFSGVNLRDVPVTEALVEQRLHSQDSPLVWLRNVISEGQIIFRDEHGYEKKVELNETQPTQVSRDKVFKSAEPYFNKGRRKGTRTMVGTFLKKELEGAGFDHNGPRILDAEASFGQTQRPRTYIFPSRHQLAEYWLKKYGEDLSESLGDDDSNVISLDHHMERTMAGSSRHVALKKGAA